MKHVPLSFYILCSQQIRSSPKMRFGITKPFLSRPYYPISIFRTLLYTSLRYRKYFFISQYEEICSLSVSVYIYLSFVFSFHHVFVLICTKLSFPFVWLVKCSLIFKLKIKCLLTIQLRYLYRSTLFNKCGIVLPCSYMLLLLP